MKNLLSQHLILFLLCALALPLQAQRISRQYHNVSMAEVLKEINSLQSKYVVNFIYDDLEDFKVSTEVRNQTVPDALRQIIGFYPIAVTQKGDVLLVECTHKTERHLTGRIVDEQGEAVPFANVLLLSPTDSAIIAGGVSNESGVFVVPHEPAKVLAKISYVGYKTVYRIFNTENAGTIRLQPETQTLQAVKVKGYRPQYKMTKGGMSIDVENTILSKHGTAIDVLGQLPRVTANGNSVHVFAKGTPLIFINNKPMRDSKELTELKSEDIKSVDVITSPGAQYPADVQSVIRIKTIKRQHEGFGFRNDANLSYNTMWSGYESASVTYRTKKLEVNNSLLWNNSSIYKEDNFLSQELHTGTQTIRVNQHIQAHAREQELMEKVGVAYAINDSNSIGASYRYRTTLSSFSHNNGIQSLIRNDKPEGQVTQTGERPKFNGPQQTVDFYYNGKAGKFGIDLNATYFFKNSRESNEIKEESSELEDRTVHSYGSQKSHLYAGKLIISYPLWKGNWSFGAEYSQTKSAGNYHNEEQYVTASETKINEKNIAGFADYSLPMGQLSFDVGLRFEHVNSAYYSFGKKQDDASRVYNDFFPSVSVSWNKGNMGVQLNYSAKTSRPSYRSLRNFMQYDNRYLYEGGNPLLRAEKNHNVELNTMYKWFNCSVGYNYTKDARVWTLSLLDDREIAYLTNRNYDQVQNIYASVTASPKFGWYLPLFEIDYQQQFFDAKKYGSPYHLNKPGVTILLRNRFQMSKTFIGTLTLMSITDNYDGFSVSKGYTGASFTLRKSFMKEKWIIFFGAYDLFKTAKERWTLYGIGAKATKDCYNYSRRISLTITYNLSTSRSKYKGTGAGNEEKRRL